MDAEPKPTDAPPEEAPPRGSVEDVMSEYFPELAAPTAPDPSARRKRMT